MHNAVLLTAVVMVCYFDGRYRRIPNFITFSLVLLGSVINSWQSGWSGLGMSLVGIITGLLLLIIPYSSGGIGGGDVKFLAGISSMLGAGFAFSAFLYGAVIGGIWAVVILIAHASREGARMGALGRTDDQIYLAVNESLAAVGGVPIVVSIDPNQSMRVRREPISVQVKVQLPLITPLSTVLPNPLPIQCTTVMRVE